MSSVNFKRRGFLRMDLSHQTEPVRPPWAIEETLFQDACTQCGDCLPVCPTHILKQENTNGYPVVDFSLGECTFCGDCVLICPTAALDKTQVVAWSYKAKVKASCLASQQVICTTCAEQCELDAIRFKPQIGKVAEPMIDVDVCTGCGACVAPCPSQAIEVCGC